MKKNKMHIIYSQLKNILIFKFDSCGFGNESGYNLGSLSCDNNSSGYDYDYHHEYGSGREHGDGFLYSFGDGEGDGDMRNKHLIF